MEWRVANNAPRRVDEASTTPEDPGKTRRRRIERIWDTPPDIKKVEKAVPVLSLNFSMPPHRFILKFYRYFHVNSASMIVQEAPNDVRKDAGKQKRNSIVDEHVWKGIKKISRWESFLRFNIYNNKYYPTFNLRFSLGGPQGRASGGPFLPTYREVLGLEPLSLFGVH